MNGLAAGFGVVYLGVTAIQGLRAPRRCRPGHGRTTLAIGQPPTRDDARHQHAGQNERNP